MRSTDAESIAPSGVNGVTAIAKTPFAVASSFTSSLPLSSQIPLSFHRRHRACWGYLKSLFPYCLSLTENRNRNLGQPAARNPHITLRSRVWLLRVVAAVLSMRQGVIRLQHRRSTIQFGAPPHQA